MTGGDIPIVSYAISIKGVDNKKENSYMFKMSFDTFKLYLSFLIISLFLTAANSAPAINCDKQLPITDKCIGEAILIGTPVIRLYKNIEQVQTDYCM